MKIATLTLPLHSNYGGIIQAYALQQVLFELGHDSTLLNLSDSVCRPYYKVFLSKIKRKLTNIFSFDSSNIIYESSFDLFINNEINLSERINYRFELGFKKNQDFDAFIVGSDQVWRHDYAGNIEAFYFDFVKDDKIILSYASSFGLNYLGYTQKQIENCKVFIDRFKAISVRENEGVLICNKNFDVDACRLLDPTMLLSIEKYDYLIDKYNTGFEQHLGVFAYLLDRNLEKENIVEYIAKHLKSNLVIFNENENNKGNFGDWLAGFKCSEFVVTDSFHGVVFSILFNKPFIAIGNKERGLSRFNTILNVFGLCDRLIFPDTSYSLVSKLIGAELDYFRVNNILYSEKNKAINFLKNNLKNKSED